MCWLECVRVGVSGLLVGINIVVHAFYWLRVSVHAVLSVTDAGALHVVCPTVWRGRPCSVFLVVVLFILLLLKGEWSACPCFCGDLNVVGCGVVPRPGVSRVVRGHCERSVKCGKK